MEVTAIDYPECMTCGCEKSGVEEIDHGSIDRDGTALCLESVACVDAEE